MSDLTLLSDADLDRRLEAARAAAHSAALATYRLNHDGTRWVEPTRAWSNSSNEWARLRDEKLRRSATPAECTGRGR